MCHVLCHFFCCEMCTAKIDYPVHNLRMWKRFLLRKVFLSLLSVLFFLLLSGIYLSYFSAIEGTFYLLTSGIVKGPLYLIAGFFLATLRSLYKGCRSIKTEEKKEEQVAKPFSDMWPSYFVNYPMTLSLIYILGNHFLGNRPDYILRAILFVLGFGVDSIFYLITHPGDLLKDLI